MPEESDIEAVVAEFAQDPHVEYAQPDYLVKAQLVPNDPFFSSSGSWGQAYDDLWGLKKLQTATAWDTTQGQGVVVAVVDSGLDYLHPDMNPSTGFPIAGNVWVNPGEDLNSNGMVDISDLNSLDDDSNGFIDDVIGWNFVLNNLDPMDGFGHGTHVSGTIAAVGNNGLGIIGVAPQAKIMPVKGLSDAGSGTSDTLAAALVYAAHNGAAVINNSWGCSVTCPSNSIIEDAVRTAHAAGVVLVFAAGNSNMDVSLVSPQNMTDPKPIIVAASDQLDQRWAFSNFGTQIDVAAPGGGTSSPPPSVEPSRNILSLKSTVCNVSTCPASLVVGGTYLRQAGTSMAAPHVSGVAALLLAHRPSLTNDEVRQALIDSADDIDAPGEDSFTGAGRVNAASALALFPTPVLGVSVNPTTWAIGAIPPGTTVRMNETNDLTVNNTGNVAETMTLRITNPGTAWAPGLGAGTESFHLQGLFVGSTDAPGASDFQSDDTLFSGAPVGATATQFGMASGAPSFNPDAGGLLTNNLLAYWKLDETSGSRVDSIGTNSLTDTNTVTSTTGKKGSASQFTAANSEYLSIPSNANLSTGDVSFTWAFWFYMDSGPGSFPSLLYKGTYGTATDYFFGFANGQDLDFVLYRDASHLAIARTSGISFTPGAWYFVVGWYDSVNDTVNMSINNGAVSSTSFVGGPASTSSPLNIGHGSTAGGFAYFNGRIDEVGFWKQVLSAPERSDLYNGGVGNTIDPLNFNGVGVPPAGSRDLWFSFTGPTGTSATGEQAIVVEIGAVQTP